MTEFNTVGREQFIALGLGALLAVIIPIVIALIWKFWKREKITTILVGAATFVLFALIIEKTIQNALVFPTTMGLPDHAASQFINARPILWAIVLGLFPGVFEETGRLVAFKTILRNRRNRETSISYGIGHGGIEVILVLGINYITYIVYGFMINAGIFQGVIDQVAEQAPFQLDAMRALADQLAVFSFADIGAGMFERVFAFLFHVGASILVFYAARDKGRFWLYPLAILLHTALDSLAGLNMAKVVQLSAPALEAIVVAFGLLTFAGAYFLLYRKDRHEALTPGNYVE
ncbi:MAG: YhfC family intramembrane metalloprotease [Clostridiales bacterium]|nr:YhfC family intramembrane metalloprotease [Clostridiales bacterium]